MDLISMLVGFLFGTATGAAGKYFADKYTDQRKQKEATSSEGRSFNSVAKRMPDLIAAIKIDLEADGNSLVREFLILPNQSAILNSSETRFVYFENAIVALRLKAGLLVDAKFVTAASLNGIPMFRMSERFVQLVLQTK
jgi:hypothetical protein